jgi:hypothetical protein
VEGHIYRLGQVSDDRRFTEDLFPGLYSITSRPPLQGTTNTSYICYILIIYRIRLKKIMEVFKSSDTKSR